MRWLTGTRRTVVALGVVCATLWVVVAGVVLTRDDDDPEPASDRDDALVAEVLSDEELELIHGAEPDPGCASEPTAAPGEEAQVAVESFVSKAPASTPSLSTCRPTRWTPASPSSTTTRLSSLPRRPHHRLPRVRTTTVARISGPSTCWGPTRARRNCPGPTGPVSWSRCSTRASMPPTRTWVTRSSSGARGPT